MKGRRIAAALFFAMSSTAFAQDDATQAAGVDFFASSDADNTAVVKVGLTFDYDFSNPENYQGVRLETFTFASSGTAASYHERGYFEIAGGGERWKWSGEAGTDGRTFLGNGTLHTDESFRQEYFLSRDLVETPLGLSRGLYFTYGGASYDIALDDRNSLTLLAGLQGFTGKNYRVQLRGTYVYAIEPDWGLSIQLRSRYYHNSMPHEFDYFSPEYYFEAIPTVQMRRFLNRWQYLAALGWGARRDADTAWKSARLVNVSVTSPPFGREWYFKVSFLYSNMPVVAAYTYNYEQVSVSFTRTL